MHFYEYKTVNTSHDGTIADSANSWAREGWRVVGVIPPAGPGYSTSLVIERPRMQAIPSSILFKKAPVQEPKRRLWSLRRAVES